MPKIVFVHGMFQNRKSWDKWTAYFGKIVSNRLSTVRLA
jgi:hypothetical protein